MVKLLVLKKYHLIVMPLLLLLLSPAGATEFQRGKLQFAIKPEPKWVINNPYPSENTEQAAVVDIDYLLYDRQISTLPGSNKSQLSQYYRQVQKPINIFGLEHASKIEINFDPNYEQLIFHKAVLHRKQKAINVLNPKKITLLQQESELDNDLVNGKVTAFLLIPGSRLGDEIEYSYSIVGQNPVFKQLKFFQHRPEADVPIGHSYFRVLTAKPLQHRLKQQRPSKLAVHNNGETVEYIYQTKMSRVNQLEENVPEWFSTEQVIELSELDSWQQVSDWAQAMYQSPEIKNAELIALIKELRPLETDQQIIQALHFVQDQIRYLGLELASNSQLAHHPDFVMEMRFGDCKDKTLLFNTILTALNIKAYPALVNTLHQQEIADMLPSPGVFNHVISMIELNDGQQFWLDPSQSFQAGSLSNNSYQSYQNALLVGHPTQSLVTMPQETAQDNRKETHSQYWISDIQQAVDLQMTTRYYGQYADFKRLQIATNSRHRIEQYHFNFMQQAYRDLINISPLAINDDTENNVFTIVENYRLYHFFDFIDGVYYYDIDAFSINGSLSEPSGHNRRQPFALVGPGTYKHTIAIRFPDTDMASLTSPIKQIETPYFTYYREHDNQDLQQVFFYQLEVNNDYVQSQDIETYRHSVQDIAQDSYEQWGIEDSEPNKQENKMLELLNDLERKYVSFH